MIKKYGLLEPEDAWILSAALDVIKKYTERSLSILEIGFRGGETAQGIHEYLGEKAHTYYCIDNDRDIPTKLPFEGAISIKGDSIEVFEQVPDGLDLVIIDGCHCVNHAALDFLHYGKKVVPRGFVFFHDTTEPMQGKSYQGHGPDTPPFGVAVRHALELVGPVLEAGWDLTFESTPPWRGARLYQKRNRQVLYVRRESDNSTGKE